ncbi:MAG: tetratricopeptide repeat protein [Gemmata sp.]
MATDTAALPAAPTDPTTRLWQLPALLLGIGVFVSAWQGWLPVFKGDPGAAFARGVDELKSNYEKLSPDPDELRAALSKVAQGVDLYPAHAPAARFHLGSGYSRLAELTVPLDEAGGYWKLARQHFDLVTDKQLRDPNDVPRLSFRAAKARAALGLPADTPPAEIVLLTQVLQTAPPGDEGGETRRLVADLALRQNPPDVAQAKISLTQYLHGAGVATPQAALARAKLRLGELHVRAKEYDQARKWLAQVGGDSPPEVLAPAKAALARLLVADGDYAGAAKELEALRAGPGVPAVYRAGAAYDLAVCRLKERKPDEAVKLFEEAAKGTGEEAAAAAFRLAELHLASPDPVRHRAAADLLADVVKGAEKPADYKGQLVNLSEVQGAFELAINTLLADRAFEPALAAADAFRRVSAAGREREKRAEVLALWAESAGKGGGDAKGLFRRAADAYTGLVADQPKSDGKLEMLRRAAALYRKADAPAEAAVRLKEAAQLPDVPDPLSGTVLLELADAMLAAGQTAEVWPVIRSALSTGAGTAMRYRLARQFVDSRHPGLVPTGRALFEQIAKQQSVPPEDREFHERALTELANDLIRQGNFGDAEARLRTQLSIYPTGPEAQLAKLLLGVCLLQKAAATATAAPDAAKMRAEALTTFKQIVVDCDAAEKRNGKLTDREGWLRLQSALRVLQTHQQMKKPQELLYDAAPLLDRHKGTVEELIVLSLVYHAFKQLGDAGKANDTRERMRDAFDKLPPSAFPQPTGEYSRDYWLKVWFAPDPK